MGQLVPARAPCEALRTPTRVAPARTRDVTARTIHTNPLKR
jgi:hypothetical protein